MATTSIPLVRNSNRWLEPEEIRALLKQNLGLNQSKVTVRAPRGNQYVRIAVRDSSVDFRALKEFVKSLNTWSISQDDVATGQSISVEFTEGVDKLHAAPFMSEAREIVKGFVNDDREGRWTTSSNGATVSYDGYWLHVQSDSCSHRQNGGSLFNLATNPHQLALTLARA